MIIERVLNVRGPKMDFYDASLFTSYSEVRRRLPEGKLYLYGKSLPLSFKDRPVYTQLASGWLIGTDDGKLKTAVSKKSQASVGQLLGIDELYITRSLGKPSYSLLRATDCYSKPYVTISPVTGGTFEYRVSDSPVARPVYRITGYTGPTKEDYKLPRVLDYDDVDSSYEWGTDLPETDYATKFINNPLVPPGQVWVSDTECNSDTGYMDYYLSAYSYRRETPEYVVPSANRWKEFLVVDEDNKKDILIKFRKIVVRSRKTLPFVNGYACFPEYVDDYTLKIPDAAQFVSDLAARNRNIVLVDFSPLGEVEFVKLSELSGNLRSFQLPESFDPKTCSFLLFIDGHIMLDSDYVRNDRIVSMTKCPVVTPAMEADRLVVTGSRVMSSRHVIDVTGTRDYFHQPNSFVVIVHKPNLQTFCHPSFFDESERSLEQGSNSYSSTDRNAFDRFARGLLVDTTLRVVRDYSREERGVTFYAEKEGSLKDVNQSSVFTNRENPIVILGGTMSDNLMSAKAMLFDRARHFANGDFIVCPKLVLVDYIFRG